MVLKLRKPFVCVCLQLHIHVQIYTYMRPTNMYGSVWTYISDILFQIFLIFQFMFFFNWKLIILKGVTLSALADGKDMKIFSIWYFQYAEDNQIPLVVLIGESEVTDGVVKVREVTTREEATVKREDLVTAVRQKLGVSRYYTLTNLTTTHIIKSVLDEDMFWFVTVYKLPNVVMDYYFIYHILNIGIPLLTGGRGACTQKACRRTEAWSSKC